MRKSIEYAAASPPPARQEHHDGVLSTSEKRTSRPLVHRKGKKRATLRRQTTSAGRVADLIVRREDVPEERRDTDGDRNTRPPALADDCLILRSRPHRLYTDLGELDKEA